MGMDTTRVYHAVVLEFRPNDPLGVSNTVVEVLTRHRREAYANALKGVPTATERSSEKLIYEEREDAEKAAQVLRAVADRVSIQQVQRRNDMETESVYGLAGWLMPSGHQYVPVSVREAV